MFCTFLHACMYKWLRSKGIFDIMLQGPNHSWDQIDDVPKLPDEGRQQPTCTDEEWICYKVTESYSSCQYVPLIPGFDKLHPELDLLQASL